MRHHLAASVSKLSALAQREHFAFQEPIEITRDGTIVDGYARVVLAQSFGQTEILCLEYDLSETEALRRLLQTHRDTKGFNAFQRIVLTLDLEPELHEQARLNQRAGGQHKGSSKLTKAERLDVRSKIAGIAGVSMGNVSKVKFLVTAAHTDVLSALRSGEISIHRAWTWSQKPLSEQQDAFSLPLLRLPPGSRGLSTPVSARSSRHLR
jgi:hypothetical protein